MLQPFPHNDFVDFPVNLAHNFVRRRKPVATKRIKVQNRYIDPVTGRVDNVDDRWPNRNNLSDLSGGPADYYEEGMKLDRFGETEVAVTYVPDYTTRRMPPSKLKGDCGCGCSGIYNYSDVLDEQEAQNQIMMETGIFKPRGTIVNSNGVYQPNRDTRY